MSEELIKQIEKAVSTTGYPLELEVGALLEQKDGSLFIRLSIKIHLQKKQENWIYWHIN